MPNYDLSGTFVKIATWIFVILVFIIGFVLVLQESFNAVGMPIIWGWMIWKSFN